MAPPAVDPEAVAGPAVRTGVRSHALGLRLDLPGRCIGLPPEEGDATRGRYCRLRWASPAQAEGAWVDAEPRRIVDRRTGDGAMRVLTVDHDPARGYRYWGRDLGECLISSDGRLVTSARETPDVALWQRFLLGQIIPFAAPLQGIEVMHGSAVEVDGEALAFLAGSGGGKSSLAAHLVLRGAVPITDDVLALERLDSRVMLHPGPALLGLRHAEADRLGEARVARLGDRLAENRKEVVVGVHRATRPVRLAAMYFIRRGEEVETLSFERCRGAELLLGSIFNTVLTGRERLARMLDLCSLLSRSAATFQVSVPPSLDAEGLAREIEDHREAQRPRKG